MIISELNGLYWEPVRFLVYGKRNIYSPLYLVSILGLTTVIEGCISQDLDQGVGQSWGKREETRN